MSKTLLSKTMIVREMGYTEGFINDLIERGCLQMINGKIELSDFEKMQEEKIQYIGLKEYAMSHSSDRFQGKMVHDRDELLEYLLVNGYFGIMHYDPSELPYGNFNESVYFKREDVEKLDHSLAKFFGEYGLTEAQKVMRIERLTEGHERTKETLTAFAAETFVEKQITPAFTELVELLMEAPDITCISDKDISEIFNKLSSKRAKSYCKQFLNFASRFNNVNYGKIHTKDTRGKGIPAYRIDTVLQVARCIFSPQYIAEHKMIEKAIETAIYAEAWLYHALLFVSAQRASDITRSFCYLDTIRFPKDELDINWDSLAEDILQDRIPEKTYETVCQYSLRAFEISGFIPSKTSEYSPPPLRAAVSSGLYPFFGMLVLIAEHHHRCNGTGYMQAGYVNKYSNRLLLSAFYGDGMTAALKGQNLRAMRLNKDYLQGVEEQARQDGCGPILSGMIASYARSHTNLDTIKAYLQDHRFEALSPEDVMFFIMEREPFGFECYNMLVTAYPDNFAKLSMKHQNKIMKQLSISPLAIEELQSGVSIHRYLQKLFLDGKEGAVLEIMKTLFEISQNRGKGKDEGIYCILRANKKSCIKPSSQSCIASCCKYAVFTAHGYFALLEIIKQYDASARCGDLKAKSILNELLLPRYKNILNQLMKEVEMAHQERQALKLMMKEYLNE